MNSDERIYFRFLGVHRFKLSMTSVSDKEDNEKKTQTYAALGIGLVCILVGVPLWWKTTEIYRVPLPYSDIQRLSQSQIQYAVEIEVISLDSTLTTSLPEIARSLQTLLTQDKTPTLKSVYRVHVRDASNAENSMWKKSKTHSDLDAVFWNADKLKNSVYTILFLPESSHMTSGLPFVGQHGILAVTVSKASVNEVIQYLVPTIQEVLIREGAVEKSLDAAQGLRTQKPDKDSMRWFRSSPGYDVVFTLINSQPDILDVQWDIQSGLKAYLNPFLQKLSNFTTISVTSQVLYYFGLVVSPHKASTGSTYYYNEQDLPHIINPLEAKLGSQASNRPTLNFVVYVPPQSGTPLYTLDQNGKQVPSNAFLSPRWGGIVIYNIAVAENVTVRPTVSIDMRLVMDVFLTQLRLLLNIHGQSSNKQLIFQDLGIEAITDWELSGWLRCRCVENLATAKASLDSLAQLLDKISNIVINDDIGQQVEDAVSSIQRSEELLGSGQLFDAFLASRDAVVASEKAFFDQSLLELLYFPEDQKFAIYIPLFLPISIPVLTSIVQAVRLLRQQHSKKQKCE